MKKASTILLLLLILIGGILVLVLKEDYTVEGNLMSNANYYPEGGEPEQVMEEDSAVTSQPEDDITISREVVF